MQILEQLEKMLPGDAQVRSLMELCSSWEEEKMIKIDILGSCVSRVSLLNGDTALHGVYGEELELGSFLDKENLALAMLPPAFTQAEVDGIDAGVLYDKSRIHALKQCLDKSTVKRLLESEAEYLVMDLYDFQNDFMVYGNTAFSTCAHEFLNTSLCKENAAKMQFANFMQLPTWLWYGYVDLFMEKISAKFDSEHMILIRFRSNRFYQGRDGKIKPIPDSFKQPYHSNDKYNAGVKRLEDYIIAKYQPYVIDYSKYYVCDENMWSNLNGAHFEKDFYEDVYAAVYDIIVNKSGNKYYGTPEYMRAGLRFDSLVQKGYALDAEAALKLLPQLIEEEDPLWLNLLAKLNSVAPQHSQVQEYLQMLQE